MLTENLIIIVISTTVYLVFLSGAWVPFEAWLNRPIKNYRELLPELDWETVYFSTYCHHPHKGLLKHERGSTDILWMDLENCRYCRNRYEMEHVIEKQHLLKYEGR